MLAIGRAGVVMLLIGLAILAIVYQQVKSGIEIPEMAQISALLGILIIVGFLLMIQGIKVHGRKHGWFR